MSATMTVDLNQFASQLDQMGQAAMTDDWTVAIKRIAVMVRAATLENFAGSHAPDGTPWLELKRPRGNSKGADKPLRDKGLLAALVTAQGQGHVEELTNNSLVYGTNLEYAGVHNYGHTFDVPERRKSADQKPWVFTAAGGNVVFTRKIKAHAVTIPARPFLGWNDKMRIDAGLIVQDYLSEVLAKAGGSHA